MGDSGGESEARASCVGLSMVAASEVCLLTTSGAVLANAIAVVLEAVVVVLPCFVFGFVTHSRSRRSPIAGMVASFCTCVV